MQCTVVIQQKYAGTQKNSQSYQTTRKIGWEAMVTAECQCNQ